MSAQYSRYNNGPRTLPWGMPILMYSDSTFTRKCLLRK
jgi:hypothetical protein